MSLFLISFFISLVGITFMIVWKLFILKKAGIESIEEQEFVFEVPDLDQIKQSIDKNTRKYLYILLVFCIRVYLKSFNFLKLKFTEIKTKVKDRLNKNNQMGGQIVEKVENNFLKKVGEYKKKITKIKRKIKVEEGLE